MTFSNCLFNLDTIKLTLCQVTVCNGIFCLAQMFILRSTYLPLCAWSVPFPHAEEDLHAERRKTHKIVVQYIHLGEQKSSSAMFLDQRSCCVIRTDT